MDESTRSRLMMDNERNLVLFSLIGLSLSYLAFNFPLAHEWILPVVLSEMAGVLAIAYGVLRYMERRKMILNGDIKVDERHW